MNKLEDIINEIEKAKILCFELNINWNEIKTDYIQPVPIRSIWTGELWQYLI